MLSSLHSTPLSTLRARRSGLSTFQSTLQANLQPLSVPLSTFTFDSTSTPPSAPISIPPSTPLSNPHFPCQNSTAGPGLYSQMLHGFQFDASLKPAADQQAPAFTSTSRIFPGVQEFSQLRPTLHGFGRCPSSTVPTCSASASIAFMPSCSLRPGFLWFQSCTWWPPTDCCERLSELPSITDFRNATVICQYPHSSSPLALPQLSDLWSSQSSDEVWPSGI